ncbi:MAG: aminotransferase class I/II-fold pyridoxal phosphate-dependent enzyme [Planctomycetota bacterium]
MSGRDFIADRVRTIGASGIRRVFDLGAQLTDPVDLSIGQPDFPVPDNVKRAMIRAIESNRNSYTLTRGIPELRKRIAQQLKTEFDWEPDLFVTSGVSGGLFLALMTCLNPGDEVLIGDPSFVSYKHLARLAGGVPVPVDLYDDFQLHPERFAAAVTPRTKLLIVGSPGNPTGVVFDREDVRALADLARQHDLLILCDEIYNLLTYDGPIASPVTFAPERTVLLRGYGKSYAMTGLRMGFAAGPTEIITEMAKLQQYTYVCAPHPAQYGALEAMDTDISARVAEYRGKRDLVCELLTGVVDFVRPAGGFYVFPKAPPRFNTASEFVTAAIEKKLLVIPGEAFSERDTHFRISYAAPDEKVRRGCAIIRELAG